MSKANVNGIELAYADHGKGEPVVFINGYTGVKESWGKITDEVSKHFRVITFDNRGVGESSVPAPDFTIADMAADTIGLMDALEIDSANIFGVSMGGLIAQIMLLDYPERVKKAVLGCTSHGGKHAVQPSKEVMDILAANADPAKTPEEIVRGKVPIIYSDRFVREEPEQLETLIRRSLQYFPSPEGAKGQMKALSRFNVKRRLHEIDTPVLAVTGSEDRMMPPENARLIADGIPGATRVVVEGAGHSFYSERPDEVIRILIDFFNP
jgi:pimeloyl-ACP methyl ester carboxylesterase